MISFYLFYSFFLQIFLFSNSFRPCCLLAKIYVIIYHGAAVSNNYRFIIVSSFFVYVVSTLWISSIINSILQNLLLLIIFKEVDLLDSAFFGCLTSCSESLFLTLFKLFVQFRCFNNLLFPRDRCLFPSVTSLLVGCYVTS